MTWQEADNLLRQGKVVKRKDWDNSQWVVLEQTHTKIPCYPEVRKLVRTPMTIADIYWKADAGNISANSLTDAELSANDWEEREIAEDGCQGLS